MKKTYATSMPNHIGAFLKASKCLAELGINITRVSYDKAVDSHMLFLDVEGTKEQIQSADAELEKIGYLRNSADHCDVVLLEFLLKDVPGSVTSVLELIHSFNFNISYISSQENGTDHQNFKMGLHVEQPEAITAFLERAQKLCKVRVIDYNSSERTYDNSIFYSAFVRGLTQMLDLSDAQKQELLISSNLAMQTLDEQGLSPYRTFDSISKFAELLARSKADDFAPRITTHAVTEHTQIILIEPACGSNTAVIKSFGKILCIDSGYACYAEEMRKVLRTVVPDFDSCPKALLLTHADVDHCGLMQEFDEIILSHRSAISLKNEYNGENGFREQNPLHKPYINICKILTSYAVVDPGKLKTPWRHEENLREPLQQIGFFDFGDLHFEVYEGKGGHLPGEIVLIDYEHNIAFTGDVYINTHGLTAEQAEYNQYAPILMTSVDTDPQLCGEERKAILRRLGVGKWKIFGAHGAPKDHSVGS
ncbi:MAG: Zn-dependent hydrolase [Oscillospiraceae bacterium]|nr:Zn-dependent hydrolase [Oscillospiraceae bacterium]